MEIRLLRYFVEIAREGNMTRAAQKLHVSQSALSKQMKELETDLHHELFRRTRAGLILTDAGMMLRNRAEDILEMVDKTEDEFAALDEITGGDVSIGCAESHLIAYLAQAIKEFRLTYPRFRFHLFSADTDPLAERLDRGLLDFAVIAEPPDLSKYNYLIFPGTDRWGLVMQKDHPLAAKTAITVDDLLDEDLICSPQCIRFDMPLWCGEKTDQLHFIGTDNLAYNGTICVRQGLGSLLTFEHLANTSEETGLTFRPLEPALEVKMYIIWKKYQVFSPIANLFRKKLIAMYGANRSEAYTGDDSY